MTVKKALVTGAGKRLGRAMALSLAERGFDVAIHFATSASAAETVADEIKSIGQRATTLQADLLVDDKAEKLVDRAAEALGGPLNVLINNASIFEYDTLETATRESWNRHIGSNLRAPFILTQAFARIAPETVVDKSGEPLAQAMIVNMVDQRVQKLTPEFMTYSIAKMGLWALTQTTAQALAPKIRVNAIAPGPTMIGSRQSEKHFFSQRSKTILNRGANPEDITAALLYLLSAPSVTGQLIVVDGGQHLAWKTPDIIGNGRNGAGKK